MPEFPTETFSGNHEGLFSAEEVKQLMRSECDRASRYGYPVTAMRMAVDRLDQLGDLYGFESRETILREVTAVVRRNTRESDFLGYKVGGTFHAIFPHTERSAGPALAGRLLRDTAKLMFDEGTARVQVTLSIGITYCAAGDKVDFDQITLQAADAIERALAKGGSRFEVFSEPEPVIQGLPPQAVDTESITEHLSGVLDKKIEDLFQSMGEKMPDFGGRGHEVLALAVKKMEESHDLMREQHARQVEMLERRLNKVSDSLVQTEDALRRTVAQGPAETGVASIYRTVQGLTDVEDDVELKKEMMSKIFEANLELHTQLPPSSEGE